MRRRSRIGEVDAHFEDQLRDWLRSIDVGWSTADRHPAPRLHRPWTPLGQNRLRELWRGLGLRVTSVIERETGDE